MNELEFTGERYVPGKTPPLIEAEHLSRYRFALKFAEGKRVLDMGCGEGYGSHILSEVARSVVGVDIDPKAIAHARVAYETENVSFKEGDVKNLPFPDDEFSAIVSFEVLEHIKDPDKMLKEAAKVLLPDGICIVSTPNGAVKVASVPNPFHVKEYTLPELKELVREAFPESEWDVEIYGQFAEGKAYSPVGIALKNAYLSLKGALGLTEPLVKSTNYTTPDPGSTDKPGTGYEFRTGGAHLAEYLVAVVTGRG